MKIALTASLLLTAGIWVGYVTYRVTEEPKHALAPCSDAVGALLSEFPQCYAIEYTQAKGLHARCFMGDVQITDAIAGTKQKYTSLLYTQLRTMKQGICDCERPYGPACEALP